MREAGAAVTVRTYWASETAATLRLLGGARGAGAPTGEERGGCISCRHAHSLFVDEVVCGQNGVRSIWLWLIWLYLMLMQSLKFNI